MAGPEHENVGDDLDIRRESSSEMDKVNPSEERRREESLPPGAGTRRAADASTTELSSVDRPSPVRALTNEVSPKVRFSADIERAASTPTLAPTIPYPFSKAGLRENVGNQPGSKRETMGVTDDTTATASGLQEAAGSAAGPTRNATLPRLSTQSQSSLPSRLSPISPTSRNRGYSLRRTLFTKSIHGQNDTPSTRDVQLHGRTSPGTRTEYIEGDIRDQSHHGNTGTTVKDLSGAAVTAPSPNYQGTLRLPQDVKKEALARSSLPNYETWRSRTSRANILGRAVSAVREKGKVILRMNSIGPSKDGRILYLDPSRKTPLIDERTGKPYIGNAIKSSRYTLWNFLPRQLFAQFSKLANFYFLTISILQMIPGLSTTGTFTTLVPLLIFVSISMAKEGYDDLRRHWLDKAENNSEASVFQEYQPTPAKHEVSISSPGSSNHWMTKKWNGICVGDIIRLQRDEPVPADLAILHSKGENGIAYIETMALDGETNLKSKQPAPALAKTCAEVENLVKWRAHMVVEDPNLDLYNFEGKVTASGETSPLTNHEIIYRGSTLRNTEEVIGMVTYTGEECKIRMNATKNPRIKAPSLQTIVNRVVIIIVLFVVALSIFNTVAYQLWSNQTEKKSWYLADAGVSFFPILASFIIMFNTMIPLSLYVSLEIIKVAQMFFLNDVDMYDEVSDTPMEARTSTINEELGQVSYIFSDKTGTLTDNSMRFRMMSIAGTAWVHDLDIQRETAEEANKQFLRHKICKGKKAARKSAAFSETESTRPSESSPTRPYQSIELSELHRRNSSPSRWKAATEPTQNHATPSTSDLIRYIQRRPHTLFARKVRSFLLAIALCHTCLPERKDSVEIDFQAASPDELALVRAAKEMGYMVIDRQAGTITLKIFPAGLDAESSIDVYEILDVIEFSSWRKRMSIIVRFPNGRICIFCKGADSTIVRLLRLSDLATEKAMEVERRANMRKSIEVQEVLRRESEQMSRKNSMNRPSLSIGRPSLGGTGRASISGHRLRPIRDQTDSLPKEKENGSMENSSKDDDSTHSRPSDQLGIRHSFASGDLSGPQQGENDRDLVDESLAADDGAIFERCFQHINEFATEGLRTLLYGYRYLDEQEYLDWKKLYQEATTSLVDRQAMIERAGEKIERNFEMAGATAIEDKLQKGVPETIDKLRRANIKLWMLTGDKRETAINVGHACHLITDYSSVTILDQHGGEVEQHIAAAIVSINSATVAHSVVVVDGLTLSHIESDETLKPLFFDLAILVDSVICCRASPSQKASLVHTIRKRVKRSVTLAIGDGANDIAMIQEAHVGIGVSGKEGLQAARTSDYSIAQFRFLLKLLLVHGRWNYVRTCKYTVGTFWKEMLFFLTQALYQRYNGYTGTSLYESASLSTFNSLFTALPVIFLGVFDKELAPATLLAVPELYSKGQQNRGFNYKVYAAWMFLAASESIIVFFCMLTLFGRPRFSNDNGLYAMGVLTYSAVVIVISIKLLLLEMHNKTITSAIGIFCSIGVWFMFSLILSATYTKNVIYDVKDGFLKRFGRTALWWLVVIFIVCACILFELALKSLKGAYWPSDVDLFQEYERDVELRKRFEEAAAMELQNSWNRGTAKSSDEWGREGEVQDLLDRPRVMEEGRSSRTSDQRGRSSEQLSPTGQAEGSRYGRSILSMDIQEMLSKRFGSIKHV